MSGAGAFPEAVKVREVGPRDGFQNEPEVIPTTEKVRLIGMLADAGLRRIEVTSFVRADVIPQLADGAEVLARLNALPGFGEQKAKIFLALLGKQYGFEGAGWREAAGDYGTAGSWRSVADIVDAESLAKVREFKRAAKAAAKK